MILFVGSVFSPTYFAARQRDPRAPAASVCAVNAVLYRRGSTTWVFTEPPPESVERRADIFALSGSRVERCSGGLVIHLDERTAPWGRPLRGRVRIALQGGTPSPLALDSRGDHHWWPIGALAKAEVELNQPQIRFTGHAYHDCNYGRVPLEDSFRSWHWSRSHVGNDACIIYDVLERDGSQRPLGLRVGPGTFEPLPAPVSTSLPRGWWGVKRTTRGQEESRLVRPLEDTPFYTRSLVRTSFDGQPVMAVHESLSMTQFVQPWVQFLLPFRLRRGRRA